MRRFIAVSHTTYDSAERSVFRKVCQNTVGIVFAFFNRRLRHFDYATRVIFRCGEFIEGIAALIYRFNVSYAHESTVVVHRFHVGENARKRHFAVFGFVHFVIVEIQNFQFFGIGIVFIECIHGIFAEYVRFV